MTEIAIWTLTPDRVEDYLHFFDRDAFVDNPAWADCYCYFYLADRAARRWEDRTHDENRAAMETRIRSGQHHGYLAYVGGKVVGWCHAAPRVALPNLQLDAELRIDDVEHVGSIVCFIVAQGYRQQGVARSLLDAACEGFGQQGLSYAEGYPRKGKTSDAANYKGPLAMYQAAGFVPFREFDDFAIVRKVLAPA